VSDLCEWKAKDQGGYYEQSEAAVRDGKRWLALPYGIVGNQMAYRKSLFASVGATQPPKTLEEWRKIGVFPAAIAVPDDAPLLHRLLGLTGRQP